MSTTAHSRAEIVEHSAAALEAFNTGDLDRLRELSGDVRYTEPATGRILQGDEYYDALVAWRTAFPDLRARITSHAATEETATIEVVWEGTHSGPLATPDGDIPPSGNSLQMPGVLVHHYSDGVMRETHHYFDLLSILRAAGAA